MNFQDWIDLFREMEWYDEWVIKFNIENPDSPDNNFYDVEDWLCSTHYTDFVYSAFYVHDDEKWLAIADEWEHIYDEDSCCEQLKRLGIKPLK